MRPMVDDIELPNVQEAATLDRRILAEHKLPGMEGSLLQNLGRRPARLTLWGIAAGSGALEWVSRLNDKFQAAEPVSFVADIVGDAAIEQMVIEGLRLQELAGRPERFAYVLVLREFIEPAEPKELSLAEGLSLDASILDDALGRMDELVDVLSVLPNLAVGLEPFVSQFSDLLGRMQQMNRGGA